MSKFANFAGIRNDDDVRWEFSVPEGQCQRRLGARSNPPSSAPWHAGFVLANGSVSSYLSAEDNIRSNLND